MTIFMTLEVTCSVRSFVCQRKYEVVHTVPHEINYASQSSKDNQHPCQSLLSRKRKLIRLQPSSINLIFVGTRLLQITQISANGYPSYTGRDPIGIELSGALKNVYAIAAGMSDGLGFENNTRASERVLMTVEFSLKRPTK